jgi:bifunctional enzyme CysN/CysC
MAHVSDLIATDIEQYLSARAQEPAALHHLRQRGRRQEHADRAPALRVEDALRGPARRARGRLEEVGTQGGAIDFALLVDGLAAEREQGITIDVAYRFFSTDKRKFIVADTPGHEQYTRNMVTGASTADAAIILVDARKGMLTQTRRHSYLVNLIGIRHVVVADQQDGPGRLRRGRVPPHRRGLRAFSRQLGIERGHRIPMSALQGRQHHLSERCDALVPRPTLMGYLETVEVDDGRCSAPFRLPVQWVNRPNLDFRGFAGTIAGGTIRRATVCACSPRGARARWRASSPATATSTGPWPGSRSRWCSPTRSTSRAATSFRPSRRRPRWPTSSRHGGVDARRAHAPGRPYLLKIGARTVSATITEIKYKVNVNTLEHVAAKRLELNEIGVCNLSLDRPIAFDPYRINRDTGGFILIDRLSNNTVGAGLLHFALRRAHNIHLQHVDVDKARACRAEEPARLRAVVHRPVRRRASPRSPTWSRRNCTRWAATPTCSTATMCATASTRTSASPTPTAWRTSAASPRSRS